MGNFFGNGSGDLTRAIRRIARQSADGIPPDESGWTDFINNGGPMSLGIDRIRRAAITGGSVRPKDLPSKVNVDGVGPIYAGDIDAGNKAQAMLLLTFFRGKLASTNAGATRTVMGDYYRENDGGTQVLNKLAMLGDDDKGYAARVLDVVPSGFTITLASKQNLKIDFPVRAGKVDFHGVPVVAGDGVWQPHFRHFWNGNLDDENDNDLFSTIVSQSATGAVITCRAGAAGSESSNQTIPFNTWTRLYYSSDNLKVGVRRNWVEIYLPQPSTTYLTSGGVLSAAGSPDATVSLATTTWFYGGVAKTLTGPVLSTLNQNDVASAALGSGEAYKAVISLSSSTTVPVVTKGTKAVAASATAPATPAGHVYIATVTVLYQAGGTSVIQTANIAQSSMVVGGYPPADVWQVPARRVRWTPSFGTERVVPEVNCQVKCNGRVFVFDRGVTITGTMDNVETLQPPGGGQPSGTFRYGFLNVVIKVSRRYVDKELEVALLRGDTVSFELEAKTDMEIASSGVDYGYAFVAPVCSLSGTTVSASEGAANQDESFDLIASLPPDGVTYTYDGTVIKADFAAILDSDFEPE